MIRVAVFRALNLGDMLCSMPAIQALRRAWPDSHIALIGLASSAALVERYRDCIDELLVFPGDPAFPEQEVRHHVMAEFNREVAERNFDLILQMHGSGRHSNRVVCGMPARRRAGFVPDALLAQKGSWMLWPDHLPETQRYLALLEWLGIPVDRQARPSFPLSAQDHAEAAGLFREYALTEDNTIVMHPGARLPSRRWPVERFAAVAAAFRKQGWDIAVTGSTAEKELGAALCRLSGYGLSDLCGKTSLGGLAALLQHSRLLVCNDTGVSHLAAAVGVRSVVIASGSDVRRWAPGEASRHRVLHWQTPCRPCMHAICPYAHPCARAVTVEQVLACAACTLQESAYEQPEA